MNVVRNMVAALAVLLVLPAAAHAHTVTPDVGCSAAALVYESLPGTTLSYEIVVNGATVVTGSLTVPVNAKFSTGETGTVTKSLTCSAPPPPAPPPAAPPAAAPPPETAAPPAPAAAAPPAPPPAPVNTVAGEQVTSPGRVARLGAHTACASRVVRITVAGRQMRDIAFSINGRHVRTVTVRAGQRSVKTSLPMRNRRAAQVVTARVRFRNGARPRTLSARASRCAQGAVKPTFTG